MKSAIPFVLSLISPQWTEYPENSDYSGLLLYFVISVFHVHVIKLLLIFICFCFVHYIHFIHKYLGYVENLCLMDDFNGFLYYIKTYTISGLGRIVFRI